MSMGTSDMSPRTEPRAMGPSVSHLWWLPAGALVGFVVSIVFGDLLALPIDFYYLIHVASVAGFFTLYTKTSELPLSDWISRRLAWAIAAGVLGGLVLMQGVLSQPPTAKFTGGILWWAILWRGIVYGAADGVLLFAFPWIVTWRALAADRGGWFRKLAAGALAWAAILLVTTTYHLGYDGQCLANYFHVPRSRQRSNLGAAPALRFQRDEIGQRIARLKGADVVDRGLCDG